MAYVMMNMVPFGVNVKLGSKVMAEIVMTLMNVLNTHMTANLIRIVMTMMAVTRVYVKMDTMTQILMATVRI